MKFSKPQPTFQVHPLKIAILACLLPVGNTVFATESCQPLYDPEQEMLLFLVY